MGGGETRPTLQCIRDAELSEREDGYLSPFLYRLMLKTGALAN